MNPARLLYRALRAFAVSIPALALLAACTGGSQKDFPGELSFQLTLKTAGNPSVTHSLQPAEAEDGFLLEGSEMLPVELRILIDSLPGACQRISLAVKAKEAVNFNIHGCLEIEGTSFGDASFLMPGLWYRKNLRSPEGAPSARYSSSWSFREDRLSIPVTSVFNTLTGKSVSVTRTDALEADALMPYKKGDVILYGTTDLGSLGFREEGGRVALTFGYPFTESPYTYIRKLTLDEGTMAFQHLEKGEERVLHWEIRQAENADYSEYVMDVWNTAYDLFMPDTLEGSMTDGEIKGHLTGFYRQSYTDTYPLKGFSGVHLRIDSCEKRGLLEVGFVGRVLMNAFNALEYGYEHEDVELLEISHRIFDSYELHGFTESGFLREVVDFPRGYETDVYSIRRQSEGLNAILQYLELEEAHNREHPVLSEKARILLDNIVSLQQSSSFPRKFTGLKQVTDSSGGSTSTAIVPLLMGWKHYRDDTYLHAAKRAAEYVESEIIQTGDYFSSTLDANCEDKEASIYASCAMYYLGLVTEGEERVHYYGLAEQAAYFALSWYYLWDVPFAPGQMLGDLGFKTRGWGNVSVENNHVDVYIFDFASVLEHLSSISGNSRFGEMAKVIRSSMREQLLPVKGRMCGIGKTGYYPEVVQHTHWDYGQYGKGYYNDIFAPGWVVSSLWELLSEDRLHDYFTD